MENIRYEYPATRPVPRRAHVGVVGSGDLEVLLSPSATANAEVVIRTSVDGYEHVWKSVLDRFFSDTTAPRNSNSTTSARRPAWSCCA